MPTPWQLESTEPNFIDGLLGGIVGFTIEIDQLEGKWKLNQNHSVERQQRVIAGLQSRPDTGSQEVADLMEHNV